MNAPLTEVLADPKLREQLISEKSSGDPMDAAAARLMECVVNHIECELDAAATEDILAMTYALIRSSTHVAEIGLNLAFQTTPASAELLEEFRCIKAKADEAMFSTVLANIHAVRAGEGAGQ